MDPEEFQKIVDDSVELIPEEFKEKLDNVAIFTADYPSFEQQKKINLRRGWTLFGLYEGVPLPKRGNNYAMVLPDRITIFRIPILQRAEGNSERAKKIVKNTIWHEIAHHFGMNEREVREAENNRGIIR